MKTTTTLSKDKAVLSLIKTATIAVLTGLLFLLWLIITQVIKG